MKFSSTLRFLFLGAVFAAVGSGCATGGGIFGPKGPSEFTIIAVGDNLIHKELINNAHEGSGKYNFKSYYSEVRGAVSAADIAFINQETLIAGESFGYSGYPEFNGPTEIGDAVLYTGFNVVNHASNHAMDKGEKAVFAVLDYWKRKKKVVVAGIYGSERERETKRNIVTIRGIKTGFLSYTYGLNGIALPKDKPYLVSLIDEDIIVKEVDALRPYCDFLVVSMHWGNEYQTQPSKRQRALAALLAAHNVDLVIGHHPHVLQPAEFFDRADGAKMPVFFSLGNFISAQSELPRMLGGMMSVTVRRVPGEMPVVIKAELIPLVTHYEQSYKNFKVYFFKDYDDGLAGRHALNREGNTVNRAYFSGLLESIFGKPSQPYFSNTATSSVLLK